ncbi:MAG: iron uptake system protein EfeO [Actinomycetaceae bacterium]|nr:iron uptake system protein EfeO [Actinomycetaceae bacterium]
MKKSIPTVAALALVLAGCVSNDSGSDSDGTQASAQRLNVTITDDTCDVSASEVKSGKVVFTLENKGPAKNEFEILAEDKLRIVGERENLGPGTTVEYTVVLEPGTYYTACKKNMVGSLVGDKEFTVTDSGEKIEVSDDDKKLQDDAVEKYTAYIRDQSGQLLDATKSFAEAYKSGDVETAKNSYAAARMHYERIEPTAEAFGDLDPALDEREADWQEADDNETREWTGWHVAEKDLWRPEGYEGLSDEERTKVADDLVANTQKLYDLVYSDDFSVSLDDISNGAIALLEEVATTKITGEEEAFSHTDLWDFQANLEGAQVAFGNVEPIAEKNDPDLAKEINSKITDLQGELDQYREGDGFVSYDTLDEAQRKALSDKVNALRRPLAKLTEAILK